MSVKIRRKKPLSELNGRPSVTVTRKALARTYGASKADISKAFRTFREYGLKLVAANVATRTVRLRGSVAQLEDAFHTKLFDYAHGAARYRGRIGALHTPPSLAGIVEAVFGLDDRRVAARRRQPSRTNSRPVEAAILDAWYTPAELAKRYRFPVGAGAGQTVALIEFGGGYFPGDLKKFCKRVDVPAPKVTTVSIGGASTARRDGDEREVMLDAEVIAGVCPKASIVLYFAPWTEQGWISALDRAIHGGRKIPNVLSISWGNAEDKGIWTNQAIAQINEIFKEAAYLGITICVAAGDDGSSDGVTDGHAHVDFPAASPYVLSVGGTTISSKNASAPDIVWKEGDGLRVNGGGSTGGGVSGVLPRPKWQKAIDIRSVNPGAIVGRCVPDVAANADWNASPYLLVANGTQQASGGTSAAAPLWAALIALINAKRSAKNPVGYLTPLLYRPLRGNARKTVGAAACTDVLSGNNTTDEIGGYSAASGYDAASGWGTPNGERLLSVLTGNGRARASRALPLSRGARRFKRRTS